MNHDASPAVRWAAYREAGHWRGRSLFELAGDTVARNPALAMTDGIERETLPGMMQRAEVLAGHLQALGIGPGKRVFLLVSHPICDIATVMALSRLDAVAFFSPPGLSVDEAARVLVRSGASLLLAECSLATLADDIADRVGGIDVALVNWSDGSVGAKKAKPSARAAATAALSVICEATRFVNFTSGTTGEPKGIQHSADTMAYAGRWALECVEPGAGSVIGLVSIAHAAGLAFSIFSALVHGRNLVLYRGRWDAQRAVDLIREHDGAWAMLIPTHLLDIARTVSAAGARLPGLSVSVGGAAVSPALVSAAAEVGITACKVFGLSECLGHTTTRGSDPLSLRMVSEGKSLPGTEDVCIDAEGRVQVVGNGEAGCRGPSMFLGYLGETSPPLSQGFFLTGDHTKIDADGRIEVLGRFKDIIIRGGENIDPVEIETCLAAVPGVVRAAVVGYADDRLGERVGAALEVASGHALSAEALAGHLAASGLAKFKWPERWLFLEKFPRGAIGKIDRKQLRARIQEQGG